MHSQQTKWAGEGLERSCQGTVASWITSTRPVNGIELLSAWFAGEAYKRHRHDAYAVCVTDRGVQVFGYRGSVHASTPGQVTVLYPDEVHDGRAGASDGFGYRIVYVAPSLLADAVQAVCGRPTALPFVEPVSSNPRLSRIVEEAFRGPLDALATDGLVLELAEALISVQCGQVSPTLSRRTDVRALERARQFLDAESARVVRSTELESVTGLTRYDLSRQFKMVFGTSPYRYLLMRRLDTARELIHRNRPLAEVACDAGFADQAHFTRVFSLAFGLPPGRYRALLKAGRGDMDY